MGENTIIKKKLSEAVKIVRGKRVVKDQLSESQGYPVYQNSLSPLGYYDDCNFRANKTFIIAAGAAGEIGFSTTDFWAADDCFVFDCGEDIDDKYLYYYLKNMETAIFQKVRKASIPRIARNEIENIEIVFPKKDVQERIVKVLDKYSVDIEELLSLIELESISREKQYKYWISDIIEQFGDESFMPLDKVGKWIGGSTPSKSNPEFWNDGDIPWVSSKDMKVTVLNETSEHVTSKALEQSNVNLLPENIITIVARSGILKHTLPVAFVPIRVTINQDIKALIPNTSIIEPRYAFYMLRSLREDILYSTKKQGGTVDSLDIKKLMNYKIPVPSIEIQKAFLETAEAVNATFEELAEKMEQERLCREKQYRHYSDKLLTFNDVD